VGQHHGGEEIQETEQQRAERLVRQELQKRRWAEADLKQRWKTDAGKVRIAARLRRETVMTLEWIAARLQMGSRYTLANCLKEFNKGRTDLDLNDPDLKRLFRLTLGPRLPLSCGSRGAPGILR